MRKFGVFLLSVIFFISLLGLALSTSSNLAFTHPDKIKSWLNQSNLYGNFVSDAIQQAKQTAGGDKNSISLNDAAVQQIAHSTFTSQLLQKDVDAFVDSNYAWLEGKSSAPDFRIDLTDAKQTFAERVGNYVETYLKNLSVCSDAQMSALSTQNNDPLTLPCRPVGMIPSTVAAQVSDELANSGAFLSDPVITPGNIDPNGDSESQPYYQNLSGLPKVYQFGTKLPLIAAAIALGSAIGAIFIAKRHRNGLRAVAIVMALAGVVLIVTKFVSNLAFDKARREIFNDSNVGSLQKALTTFMHHVQDQLVKVDLWFGIAYLILAALILGLLYGTRRRQLTPAFLRNEPRPARPQKPPAPRSAEPVDNFGPASQTSRPARVIRTAPPITSPSSGPAKPPRRRKPSKLIQ